MEKAGEKIENWEMQRTFGAYLPEEMLVTVGKGDIAENIVKRVKFSPELSDGKNKNIDSERVDVNNFSKRD